MNTASVQTIQAKGIEWVHNMLKTDMTITKPGSISHLLYGDRPSEQSVSIKLGRLGEYLAKEIINAHPDFELLQCGVQKINDRKKDVDLIYRCKSRPVIYYRELKGNIELDTEKLPATITKCKDIVLALQEKYPDHTIDCGVLNWSVYARVDLMVGGANKGAGLPNIKAFENGGIPIEHMGGFFNTLQVPWCKDEYYSYFREIGNQIKGKTEGC
jgi:hypothetical protein